MTKRLYIAVMVFAFFLLAPFCVEATGIEWDIPIKEAKARVSSSETKKALKRPATPELKRIRFHRHNKHTRLVLDLSRPVRYALASQNTPPALLLDLRGLDIDRLKKKFFKLGGERIKTVQLKQLSNGVVRIIVRTRFIRDYRVFTLKNPSRIVIDIKDKTTTAYQKPKPTARPTVKTPEQLPAVKGLTSPDYSDDPDYSGDPDYPDYNDEEPFETAEDSEETRWSNLKINGSVVNESAYRISKTRELTKSRTTLKLNMRGELTDNISFKLGGRSYYDAVFDMTGNYPDNVEEDHETELELRETYLDLSLGNMDLRLGKQNIVWGEAVGLFFADQVNAKDLREFVLADFDDIRKPQWAALIEYSGELSHIELVWIPVLEFNDYGEAGSEFPASLALPSGVAPTVTATDEPGNNFRNSEYAARFSYLLGDWDLSIFHLYTWDKEGATIRTINSPTSYTFMPTHRRVNISGFTVAKEVNDMILKAEVIYTRGKYFSVIDSTDIDGLVKADYIDYLIGVDYTFFNNIETNLQFMQRIIPDHDDRFFRQKHISSTGSFRIKTGFFDNSVEPELLVISSLQELDMMIRPKVGFTFKDNWRLFIGADIFAGETDGIFGQYKDKDRIYTELGYSF